MLACLPESERKKLWPYIKPRYFSVQLEWMEGSIYSTFRHNEAI